MCVNFIESDIYTNKVTGEIFKISRSFNCGYKCLICPLMYNQFKKQYAGQTADNFRFRLNNYKCSCC